MTVYDLIEQVILGGLGEAAAYLGVQLRMPVTAAAEFAAKMQDATRTAEGDMMALMDTIQRGFYLGVDSNNMLEGFTKLSPVLSIIRKQGLAAVNELAPLLVMMDQTGMQGQAAGNAIRKVLKGAMNTSKVKKARRTFDALWRPHLKAFRIGTSLIFDRHELDALFDRFKAGELGEGAEPLPSPPLTAGQPKAAPARPVDQVPRRSARRGKATPAVPAMEREGFAAVAARILKKRKGR